MFRSVKKVLMIFFFIIAANAVVTVDTLFDTSAFAAAGKKAKWNTPTKSNQVTKKSKFKARKKFRSSGRKKKYTTHAKKMSAKSYNRPVKAPKNKKIPLTAKIIKKVPPKKITYPKKAPVKELMVEDPITDEEIDAPEERSTSPLLVLFVTFVLACVTGMFFLNNRRKQMEAARANFQDATVHDSAFGSRAGSRNSAKTRRDAHVRHVAAPAHSSGRNPEPATNADGFLSKLSNKASDILGASSGRKGRSNRDLRQGIDAADSAAGAISQFETDLTGSDSITTIGAVRSIATKTESRISELPGSSGSLSTNSSAEPCSFERYVEIQVAAQCWRTQKLSLDSKLRELFGISTEELLQFEFHWKQKISGNINLRKKYQELEPLFSAKYDAA